MCFCINKWKRSSQQPLPATGVPVPTPPGGSPCSRPSPAGSGPCKPNAPVESGQSHSPLRKRAPPGSAPAAGQRVRAPAGEVTAAPRSGRLNLPPARAPRAGREKRCGGGATGLAQRGGARPSPGRPAGPGTRAPALAPSCRPASRGDVATRPGAREPLRRPPGTPPRSGRGRSVRRRPQDPAPTTRATYRGAGPLPGLLRSPAGPRTAQSMRSAGLGPP